MTAFSRCSTLRLPCSAWGSHGTAGIADEGLHRSRIRACHRGSEDRAGADKVATCPVIFCENIVGDLLSDLDAAMIGGLGPAPWGKTSDDHGMFQCSHGFAPGVVGTRIACIQSGVMLVDWLTRGHNDLGPIDVTSRIGLARESV